MRRRAEERLQRRSGLESGALLVGAMAGGFICFVLLYAVFADGNDADDDMRLFRPFLVAAIFGAMGVHFALVKIWVRLRPQSAVAVLAARRRRLVGEQGAGAGALLISSEDAVSRAAAGGDSVDGVTDETAKREDPEIAEVRALLRSMGAKPE